MIKQAYKQYEALEELSVNNQLEDSIEEEEFKNRSRDVGHNIYILAHQVGGEGCGDWGKGEGCVFI